MTLLLVAALRLALGGPLPEVRKQRLAALLERDGLPAANVPPPVP